MSYSTAGAKSMHADLIEFENPKWRPTLYSKASQHAIAALVHLARHSSGRYVSVKDIAGKQRIPFYAFAKVVRQLSTKGFVRCSDGPGGGVMLRGDPAAIRLADVVDAFDGELCCEQCAMGHPVCSPKEPCAMHESWQKVREQIRDYLQTTIAEIVHAAADFTTADPHVVIEQEPEIRLQEAVDGATGNGVRTNGGSPREREWRPAPDHHMSADPGAH